MTSYDNIPRGNPPDPADPLAARVRAALTSEADMVNPSDDGLQRIRAGVDAGRRPWWQHPAALAVAAAAVVGLAAGGLAVALGGDDGEDGNVIASQTSDDTSTSPEPSETTTEATDQPQVDDVYVYYVMDDADSGPRLYREQHAVRARSGDSPVVRALTEMFKEPPVDPDYSSFWTGTELVDYSVSGGTATVDIEAGPPMTGETAPILTQQLVYTVTANDKSVEQVKVTVGGYHPSSQDIAGPTVRAPMLDVQGLVWLLGPAEGATVPSPVQITGYGTAFEATISWQVRREGSDAVVAEGFTSGGANGEFSEFTDTVELEPGTYEVRAFESSAEDGRPLHTDSKTFTVG